MNKDIIKAQDIFLDRINHICNKFGLNNVMAQLYAILYLSNKPLSLNDMVDRLKISKGSASVNIRALERYGAVKRVWVRGSRRDYYEADTDIVKVVMDRVKIISQLRFSEIDAMTKSCYDVLNSVSPQDKDDGAAIKIFKQRLDKIETLRRQAHSLFNLVNSGILNTILNTKLLNKSGKEPAYVSVTE